MKLNRSTVAAAAAVLALSVAGCGTSTSSSSAEPVRDGTISYGFSVGPKTLDPGAASSVQELLYLRPVYDRLVYLDPLTNEAKPMLATKWTIGSDDQSAYVDFTLREGLTFPDGAPFNSSTVVANIERSKSLTSSAVAADLTAVTGAEALSEYVARVRSTSGAAWIPPTFGSRAGMMISQTAVNNPDLATKPVGIGMWTLDTFDPAKVTYTKTPNYWDSDAQKSDRLELRFLPDDTARFNAVRSGDLDMTFIRASQLTTAKNAGLNIDENTGATVTVYLLNTSVDGLDNLDVRHALQMAIDRDSIAKQLFNGHCTPSSQLWSPALPWANPDVKPILYKPKEAKKAIADAGYAGLKLTIYTQDSDLYKNLTAIIQAQLKKVGVDAEVKIGPANQTRQVFSIEKSADVTMSAFGLEGDPSQLVSSVLLPDGIYNPGHTKNPKIGSLAKEALGAGDADKRAQAYQQISKLAVEDAGYLAICAPNFLWATQNGLTGFDGALSASQPEWRDVAS